MSRLNNQDILKLVYEYIGVNNGYLGDFSYKTHAEFYKWYCNLDVDLQKFEGTTREKFIEILRASDESSQIKIVKGILVKYPESSEEHRTATKVKEITDLIKKLEAGCGVPSALPSINSNLVTQAINDAEILLTSTHPSSGIDRMHTAFHGYLKTICDKERISYPQDSSLTHLYKALRENHPGLNNLGTHSHEIDKIIKSLASAIDSLNTLRNRASIAHPNQEILAREESYLYINAVRTLMAYIDIKISLHYENFSDV